MNSSPQNSGNPFSIVQLVKLSESADSLYRMRWPAESLASQMPNWKIINLDAFADERYEWALHADLLVLFQSRDIDLIPVIKERKKAQKKTILEINDNFYAAQEWSPVSQEWSSALLWQDYEVLLREVDVVQVSSDGLKTILSEKLNLKNIEVLPNQLPVKLLPFDQVYKQEKERIKIGWAGSFGHASDLLKISPALLELTELDANIEIHLMCSSELFSFIKPRINSTKLFHTEVGDFNKYLDFLKKLDIGVIPLNKTAYNLGRSDIKAIEYSAFGVTPLVQKADTYNEFIRHTNSPTFETNSELVSQISELIKDPLKSEETTKRCYDYVKTKRQLINSSERSKLYNSLMPATSDSFFQNVARGYNYIIGTQSRFLPRKQLQKEVNLALEQKNISLASNLLSEALDRNPYLTDAALSELELFSQCDTHALKDKFKRHHQNNPSDLRITQFGLRNKLIENESKCWYEVIKKVEENSIFAKFYEKDLCSTLLFLMKQAERNKEEDLKILKKFYQIYPNSVILLQLILDQLIDLKRYSETLEYLKKLSNINAVVRNYSAELDQLNQTVLSLWTEAVENLQTK